MTKPISIEGIEKATDTPWAEWVAYLNNLGAKELIHKEIAELAYERLKAGPKLDNSGWWSQSIAVAYEQHIGRREPGQRSDGSYEVAVSKTIAGTMDEAMRTWIKLIDGRKEFAGTALAAKPTTTKTDNRRHWACNLADGSRLNADVYQKTAAKANLTITHSKLPSQKESERWRVYWKSVLG